MAPQVDIVVLAIQLKKLTKDELINLIIHKDVRQFSALSDQTVEQLEIVLAGKGFGEDGRNVVADDQPRHDDGDGVLCLNLKYMEKENAMLRKMCLQFEDRIEEQKSYIKLLQQNVNPRCSFAQPTKATIKDSSQQTLVKESVSTLHKKIVPATVSDARAPADDVSGTRGSSQMAQVVGAAGRPVVVRGTAPTPTVAVGSVHDTFAAVARRAFLYLGNVNPNAEKKAVEDYIKDKCPKIDLVLEDLPKRDHALSRAYKLTVDYTWLDTLNKPDFWPDNIIVKRFFRAKLRR